MAKKIPFRCPLCESTCYAVVGVKRPNGQLYQTEFFECSRCSVMFRNSEAFTLGKEAGKEPPRRWTIGIQLGVPHEEEPEQKKPE